MNKGKTGLIILTLLAALFFLFIAIVFNTSTKRQYVIDRRAELEARLDLISHQDITIYWIGEPLEELEHLSPVINVITPGSASRDNLPVKSPAFHTLEYNPEGVLVDEQIPIDYTKYMLIVISGSPVLTDNGKEALLDSIAKNGVPVLAIGDEASDLLGDVLSYRMISLDTDRSLYYCLGRGYSENPIPKEKVKAGGMDLAETLPDLISLAEANYIPQN